LTGAENAEIAKVVTLVDKSLMFSAFEHLIPKTVIVEKEGPVVSDPLSATVARPVDVLELHLGEQGIEEISGFEQFRNLEELWLNNNKVWKILSNVRAELITWYQISKVINLERNFRLKKLYLQSNMITKLGPCIRQLKFLETLVIAKNRIRDLKMLLQDLMFLPYLKVLGMRVVCIFSCCSFASLQTCRETL